MAEPRVKSLAKPDEVMTFPRLTVRVVDLGDITVGHFVNEPGCSWKECMQPTVGGEWCQARHPGMVISDRLGVEFSDGFKSVAGSDRSFEDRGVHTLKGLDGEWQLSRFIAAPA